MGAAAISIHSTTSAQAVRSRRERNSPLLVLLTMVCDYSSMHKITFIEAYKVSRSVPGWVSTNVQIG